MKTIEELRNFIAEKVKETEFKIGYATELFDKLDLPEKALQELSYDIYENKGVLIAYSELLGHINKIRESQEKDFSPTITDFAIEPIVEPTITVEEIEVPIATKLSIIGERLDKNQYEIADMLGCGQSTVSRLINNKGSQNVRNRLANKIDMWYKNALETPYKGDLDKFKE